MGVAVLQARNAVGGNAWNEATHIQCYEVYISHSSTYHSVEQLMEGILEHGSLHRPVQHKVVHRGSIVHGELKIKKMLTHNITFKPQLIIKML